MPEYTPIVRQSDEYHAASKREDELYRRCIANPMSADWEEYRRARRATDALYRTQRDND